MPILVPKPVNISRNTSANNTVGVFRTNIQKRQEAMLICNELKNKGLVSRATVDLQDCDRILRTVGLRSNLNEIVVLVQSLGFSIEELSD